MKKILLVLALALSLPACTQLQNLETAVKTTITPDNLNTLEAAYGSALSVAVGYRNLCKNKIISKSCWTVIAMLQPYENKAYGSIVALRQFLKNNPTLDASTFISDAKTAIATFKSVQTLNGVN